MSITIDWHNLTTGPSGLALADSIRDFIHDKFQQVTLPRFIRSVHVHSFDFGDECPAVELKDITDPLPEFDEDEEEDGEDGDEGEEGGREDSSSHASRQDDDEEAAVGGAIEAAPTDPKNQPAYRPKSFTSPAQPPDIAPRHRPPLHLRSSGLAFPQQPPNRTGGTPLLSRSDTPTTPGIPIPGGTSNFTSYFHLPLSAGLSGTQTPLLLSPWGEQQQQQQQHPPSSLQRDQHKKHGAPGYPSAHNATSADGRRMTARAAREEEDTNTLHGSRTRHDPHHATTSPKSTKQKKPKPPPPKPRAPLPPHAAAAPGDRSQDLQTTLHISYAGSLSLSLTAEILLDYPMPSFVGIPLKLQITGLRFDGVALLAYLRHNHHHHHHHRQRHNGNGAHDDDGVAAETRKVQFCFLGREDARAMVGGEEECEAEGEGDEEAWGGLLREIRVESEIGRQEEEGESGNGVGKPVLKNVGKVERFVLEQVRRIFEEEFVWPSFWTFLL